MKARAPAGCWVQDGEHSRQPAIKKGASSKCPAGSSHHSRQVLKDHPSKAHGGRGGGPFSVHQGLAVPLISCLSVSVSNSGLHR